MTTPDVPYRFELELTVTGTPEQVWEAIATAEGLTSWMTPTTLEPQVGGAVAFDMGPDATSHGKVTAFEPARHIAYEEYWDTLTGHDGAAVTPLVTEFLIEARSGGTCVVHVVTSAFGTGADWEQEFWDEMDLGWGSMLDNLRLYLASFPGQHATPLWAGTTVASTPEQSVAAIRAALVADASGEAVNARGVTGRFERSLDRHFLVRIEEPVGGFLSCMSYATEEGSGVHLQGYLFGEDAPAYVEREQPQWQAWLDGVAAEAGSVKVPPG